MTLNLEDNIQTILQNLVYLKDNAPQVYGSKSLQKIYDIIQHNESSAINDYAREKNEITFKKLYNWLNILIQEKKLSEEDLSILNTSNDDFIKEFNDNIVKINTLDREITTKDKMIEYNQYAYESKVRVVIILRAVALYIFLMYVPLGFIGAKVVSMSTGLIFIFFCALSTIIAILVKLSRTKDIKRTDILNKGAETAQSFVKDVIKDIFPKSFVKPCPERCVQPEEENPPPLPVYDYNHGNEVWLDNSNNRWKKGDVPTIGATEEGYLELGEEVEPMRYYGGDKDTPKYTCKWKYDPSKMTNMNKGLTFVSTIPCEYYPGYENQ